VMPVTGSFQGGQAMDKQSVIFVAGHQGLVGSALLRCLQAQGYQNILTRSREELDLTRQEPVEAFFRQERPDYVFLAAARVGGIAANQAFPAEFIRDNLLIQTQVLDAAYRFGVRKLLFLGSSCIYPRLAPQPLREEYLLTGALEKSNQAYAIAKIAGVEMCQAYRRQYGCNFIVAMPTNLYGPGDNFDWESSHVVPALLGKFHEAKSSGARSVMVWGSGRPRREFLHVDDLAEACLFLMEHYDEEDIINVGTGQEVTIAELAVIIGKTVGFEGEIVYDPTLPDGTPRKLLDTSRLHLRGWKSRIPLEQGIAATYNWYLQNLARKEPGQGGRPEG